MEQKVADAVQKGAGMAFAECALATNGVGEMGTNIYVGN
jgi:hypothetical protein